MLPALAFAAPEENTMIKASLVSLGDVTPLQRVMAKAQRGEPVVVGVIGGSITAGAAASKPEYRYGNRIAAWWQSAFPGSKVEFVNAGIGATGSSYAVMRAQRDLLSHKPDFVVVEFAVNDPSDRANAESYEGLVRQILRQPQAPAVLLLFMMTRDGHNAQEWEAKVGAHYSLPMVSYRDAIWGEMQAGRLAWTDVSPDMVHPNDWGHEQAAKFVTSLLEQVRTTLPAQQPAAAPRALPQPLFTALFDHTTLLEAADLIPVSNQGWVLDEKLKCWKSDQPGSVIEFDISGKLLYAAYYRIRGAMGRAQATVDGGSPTVLEGWFDQTWGGYRHTIALAQDLPARVHRVRVELLADKAADSTGHEFRLLGLSAAGGE